MNIFNNKISEFIFLEIFYPGEKKREREFGRSKSVVSQAADVHVRARFSARPERLILPLQEQRGEYVSGAIRARGHRFVSLKRLEAEDFEQSLYREQCTCSPAGFKDRQNSARKWAIESIAYFSISFCRKK